MTRPCAFLAFIALLIPIFEPLSKAFTTNAQRDSDTQVPSRETVLY